MTSALGKDLELTKRDCRVLEGKDRLALTCLLGWDCQGGAVRFFPKARLYSASLSMASFLVILMPNLFTVETELGMKVLCPASLLVSASATLFEPSAVFVKSTKASAVSKKLKGPCHKSPQEPHKGPAAHGLPPLPL